MANGSSTLSMAPTGAGAFTDIGLILNQIARNGQLIARTISQVIPRVSGTFTLANATTTVVTQAAIKTNSIILWSATNSTAAVTLRTRGLFLASQTSASGFTMSTDNGVAAGTEVLSYVVINPA